MAVTLGSTGITFPDATTQTTAATGGGSIQATFTAASAITAGQTVQFTTGTSVEAVAGTVYTQSVAGNNTVYSGSTTTDVTGVAFDPNTAGSFVTFAWDGALKITAGTLSGNTTTLGTTLTVSTGTTGNRFYTPKVMFDPVTAGKCMLVVQNSAGVTPTIKAYIFTVSGTTITLASQTDLLAQNYKCAFSYYAQDAFVYTYLNSTTLYAVACSISGSTITQGTATSIATSVQSNDGYSCIDLDYVRTSSNQLAAAFINSSNNDAYAVVFTVTPATKAITAGTAVVMISGITASGVSVACDPFVSRIAVAYWNSSSGVGIGGALLTAGTNALGTNTTWVTLPSPYNTGSGGSRIAFATTADGENNKSVLVHFWTGNYIVACCNQFWSYYFRSGILAGSGTPTITWGAYSTVAADLTSGYIALGSFNQTNQVGKFPLVYKAASNSTIMKLGQATLTDTNFDSTKIIGIANASASSSASVVVNVFGGVDTHQTGLTANTNYYVDQTGALTTSATAPNVSMGKALSATSILIKGLTI